MCLDCKGGTTRHFGGLGRSSRELVTVSGAVVYLRFTIVYPVLHMESS